MKYYSLQNIVGISVDEKYPWVNTLFINNGLAEEGHLLYEECPQKIDIIYSKNIKTDDVRLVAEKEYIGENVYYDAEYGVRIERISSSNLRLMVKQECNEWLVIAVQLLMLQNNCTLVHAAAIEKEGKILLLPSWGGVGKTATVCKFVKEYNWRLLGDDLIVLDGKCARSFLKPFVIYPYHRQLFPELFESGENHTVKNLALSKLMSRIIPSVKRILRPFPGLLAYVRKHNPQSMRVSPRKIFKSEQLSLGGEVNRVVWLERSMKDTVNYTDIKVEQIVSKTLTVSIGELFADKLNAVIHMCGCGVFDYNEIFEKMRKLITSVYSEAICGMIEIPVEIPVTEVGEIIYSQIFCEEGK